MSNPYVSRGPVQTGEMFFGRVHELQEIAAFINGNQSISIIGPRKIGKTSLLFQLVRPDVWPEIGLEARNLFVYLDCEVLGESSHEELFGQFAGEMAVALDFYGLPPEPALDAVIAKPGRLSFEAAVRKLNQRGLRVVLILDEFERLSNNPHLNLNFFNALRSAAGRYQLVFLTASARPLIELTYSGHSQEILSSPFFNIFAPLFLGLMPEREARELICGPATRAGQPFSAAMEAFIYELAGGHPLALQVACFHAFSAPDDLREVEAHTTRELNAHFQYYWRNLTPIEQDALRSLSEAHKRADNDTTLRTALRDLIQKCLIVQVGDCYTYSSRAWGEFVTTQNPSTANPSRVGGALTGVIFGPYEVRELLGRGGMAEVYKGHHQRLDRTVAIKVLSAQLAAEGDFRRRFEREARAVAALRHPNIVQVFDFGDIEGVYYMVMEYIDGDTLAVTMHENGPMSLPQVRPIIGHLASALDYAHAQGIVHRDIKPTNVMVYSDRRPGVQNAVLTDFGIAKMLRGDPGGATKDGGLTGTLDYMAPEQIRGSNDVDSRADVYGLGVMLYQMLTGELPFHGDNPGVVLMGHLQQDAPDPRVIVPGLPAHAAEAVLRAMAKDREERFQSAGELAAALH